MNMMPITLRTRPTCHYCGKRNSPSNNQLKFTCQHCQAENYLDQFGQITDVPASAAVPSQQYAIAVTPAFESAQGSIFCSTCLKNQYMYNTALSEYLPDPDHPEYDRFEAAIPAFKKDLERRFPTCCANCEPNVKAQLQQATYNARSDHVRRVLDRSRHRRHANRWGWRSLLVSTAGLGWLASLAVQLIWHALGSQAHDKVVMPNIRPTECLVTWPVPAKCPTVLEIFVGPSLVLGILCMWWNPKWQHKLEGREGRLVGLGKFYKVQGALLALRFASWTVIKDVPNLVEFRSMIHTISLVLVAMIAMWSCFNIITIYMPRIVDWSQNPAPLLDNKQYIPPAPTQGISPPSSQNAVPVDVFNTATPRSLQSWRPPTPPVDEDAMEWDPTPTAFNPNLKQLKYKSTQPTPFQGTLPALQRSGIYGTKKETAVEQPKAIGLPLGFFDKSHGKPLDDKGNAGLRNAELAEPKFFPDVAKADTGLEGIFDKVFSLQDEAKILTRNSGTSSHGLERTPHGSGSLQPSRSKTKRLTVMGKVYNGVVATLLATFATLFSAQCYLDSPVPQLISSQNVLHILIAIPLVDVAVEMALSQAMGASRFDVPRYVIALLQSFALSVLNNAQPDAQSLLLPLWNKLLIASLTLLMGQELYGLVIDTASPPVLPDLVHLEDQTPNAPPSSVSIPQAELVPASFPGLRRSSSDESIASTASIATTSTASGWKTPVRNHREELNSRPSSTSYGFGGLSLKNDHTFGAGNSVAGPRSRRTPARGGQRGW